MIGRAIWVLAIVAVALVTAGYQLDRQSRYQPAIAPLVPEPFRAFAQEHVLVMAARSGDENAALSEARKLVARRPMPADHMRALSAAQIQSGAVEEAGVSIQLAARRGWRDQPTQQAMLELALAAGDDIEAARRFAALFVREANRTDFLAPLAQRVFAPGNEGATAEFARIVSGAERWRPVFLRRAPATLPAQAHSEVCSELESQPGTLRCE